MGTGRGHYNIFYPKNFIMTLVNETQSSDGEGFRPGTSSLRSGEKNDKRSTNNGENEKK